MESLTIEDLDLYSMASRRATREDIYSIVDTTFMPSGIECDQYSILGEIKEVICKKTGLPARKSMISRWNATICISAWVSIKWTCLENRFRDVGLKEKYG